MLKLLIKLYFIMNKQLNKITNLQFKQNAPGFNSVDTFHSEFGFEPFLVFTEFHMDRPIFGPHPHAGVSVMTYMMPDSIGSFINRDSRGDHSVIEPGGIHVTQAGSGIKHDEVPQITGTDCHGFQIWINHADKDRLVEPKAFHAMASDVPQVKNENSFIRIIQGEYQNIKSPIELVTKTTLLDITLQPNTSIELDAKEMAFVYLINGEIKINEAIIANKAIVNFTSNGNKIIISTLNKVANLLFATGTPHNEPIVYGGPFVMTTEEQMHKTKLRLGRGEMGELGHL